MPALLAWLDHSEADQRRAREIVAMFSQSESRDELGLGGVRDALSETLFPGTSVLLTRARYLLFVPWLFREGERRNHRGDQLTSWVDWYERRLIGALRAGGDLQGLIGRNVGEAVRILPSTIYWNSLRRFRILRHDVTSNQITGLPRTTRLPDDATEFLERDDAVWDPSLPDPPDDFLSMTRCDFALPHDEATWLAERIVEAVPGTLLGFLVAGGRSPSRTASYAWEDADADAAPGPAREALADARRFAVAMHGAQLLYNVLLAERAEEFGLARHEGRRDDYASRLDEWCREVDGSDLGAWDLDRLWTLVAEQGRPAASRTCAFVTAWLGLMRGRSGTALAADPEARALVRDRELYQKRGQSRLRNDRLMRQWGGASGSARLDFRWPAVAGILADIAAGRGRGHARP